MLILYGPKDDEQRNVSETWGKERLEDAGVRDATVCTIREAAIGHTYSK